MGADARRRAECRMLAVPDEKIREYSCRIMIARMKMLCDNGFYGLLLMHVPVSIGTDKETVWVEDGDRIVFHPDFLDSLNDEELEYALQHVILHIVLRHFERSEEIRNEDYDLAADIVVNSNILRAHTGNCRSISLSGYGGVQPHLAPNGDDGWKYTVEEILEMLKEMKGGIDSLSGGGGEGQGHSGWDDHASGSAGGSDAEAEQWQAYVCRACESMAKQAANLEEEPFTAGMAWGAIPAFVERMLENLRKPQTDWRTILQEFVQEELVDYSFVPPDRRFPDSPFLLPDFNVKDEHPENILFMIDTSGSMSGNTITMVYSEVKGAIDQFDGKLKGWLGFFNAAVTKPQPFENENEFLTITPVGGGGTSFQVIFDYVNTAMRDEPPASIVILTDGYAPFPDEKAANGIPVLWILTTDVEPPWGKVARVTK